MRSWGRDARGRTTKDHIASAEASRIADEAPLLLDRAAGVDWYERAGNDIDFAAYMLCRLRRARAGEKGGLSHGDEAVRVALLQADPESLVWFTSRAISYMDETGFPEAVEPWFAETDEE